MNLNGIFNIISLIVGVTLVTVLVRPGNQTAVVIGAGSHALNSSLAVAQGQNVRTYGVTHG